MSRTFRTRTPTFRFNRNDDDLLEEVLESNEAFDKLEDDASIESLNQSIGSSNNSTASEINGSNSSTPRERSSVKDFIASKLNKTRSLDEENDKESITSKWFNEVRVKIREKIDERKREKEGKEKEKHLNDSIDTKLNESELHSRDSPLKLTKPIEENIQNNINELSSKKDPKKWSNSSLNNPLIQTPELEVIDFEPNYSNNEEVVDNFDDCNLLPDITKSPQLWTYSQIFNTSALLIALISLGISVLLPIHSFIRGLLFGSVLTIILFSVLIFYIISKFFVMKSTKRVTPRREALDY